MQTATEEQQGIYAPLDDLIRLRMQADTLRLYGTKRVATMRAGLHQSLLRGRGIEFDEVRQYQPGDDIRTMDWRVTARTGEPHTKVFHEERERPVYIIVDYSPSMYFGSRVCFKSVIASQVAAILAWATINNGDQIGAVLFSGEKNSVYRAKSRHQGALPIMKALSEFSKPHAIDPCPNAFADALHRVQRVTRPGSLVFVLSDFLGFNKQAQMHMTQLAKHCEVVGIYVYDQLEKNPPPPDSYSITDGQQIAILNTDNRQLCNEYRFLFEEQHQQLADSFYNRRIPLLELATHDSLRDFMYRNFGAK